MQQKKINRILQQKELCESLIFIGNLCVQTKIMIITKRTYPLPPSTVFLIAEKLLKFMTLKFWDF